MRPRKKSMAALSAAVVCLLASSAVASAGGSPAHRTGYDHYNVSYSQKGNGPEGKMKWSSDQRHYHQPNKKGKDSRDKRIEWTLTPKVSIVADLGPAANGMRTEGLTGDQKGRLYTSDMDSRILYRVTPKTGQIEKLTVLPRSASGMAFDKAGNLYLASGGSESQEGVILRISADTLKEGTFSTEEVTVYATGVKGANGLVFDNKGVLFVSGGATGNIYRVLPDGTVKTWASGITAERPAQQIVVNGLAFDQKGYLYIANTSSGEINRVKVYKNGSFGQVEQLAKDDKLYGADGIIFGRDGNLYVAANERNAIVQVTKKGIVTDITTNDNHGPLEFPASLHIIGNSLFASNFDVERGVNAPNAPGIGASIAEISFGKK